MVRVDLEVTGGRCCNGQWVRLWSLTELAAKNLFRARGIVSINRFQNSNVLRSPLSSVVERVTRNDEVGCSIQPAGISFAFTSFFFSLDRPCRLLRLLTL